MNAETPSARYDALIIGAGPAGATATLMLARMGWSVAVVEQMNFPRRKVCGEFISATSFPLLWELGLGENFFSLAGPEVRRLALFAGKQDPVAPIAKAENIKSPWGRALGREHFDLLLLEAARKAGAKVWQPYKAVKVAPAGEGWQCTIAGKKDTHEIWSRIIIAAHGSWSRGPLSDQRQKISRPTDLLGFKAHLEDCDLSPDLMPLLIFPGGYGGMVTSDSGRVSLSCCIRRDALAEYRMKFPSRSAGEAVFEHIVQSSAAVRSQTRRSRLSGAWLSVGPVRPSIRTSFDNGIFRIGNLAAEAHPIIAEGISMAMQSADMLCRELIAAQDDIGKAGQLHSIGQRHEARWRARFRLRIRVAAALAHVAMRPVTAPLIVQPAAMFPAFLTLGAALSGKATMPEITVDIRN